MQLSVIRKWLIGLSAAVLLSACSSQPAKPQHSAAQPKPTPSASARHSVVATAYDMLGTPYRYGGASPRGFDCSGLVWFSHRQAGINVPRTTREQMAAAKTVEISQLNSGDLLFFRIDGNRRYHVGVYIGNGRFIHAPSSGKTVSIAKLDNPYWKRRLLHSGRFY